MLWVKLFNGICCNYSIKMYAVQLCRIYSMMTIKSVFFIGIGNNKFILFKNATILRNNFCGLKKKNRVNELTHWFKAFATKSWMICTPNRGRKLTPVSNEHQCQISRIPISRLLIYTY